MRKINNLARKRFGSDPNDSGSEPESGPESTSTPPWAAALRPYQWRAAQWLAEERRFVRGGLLALKIGFGKTQALIAAARLRSETAANIYKPIIVFCPAAVKGVWKREAGIIWPELPVYLVADEDPVNKRKGEGDEAFALRRDEALNAALASTTPCLIVAAHSYQGADRVNARAPQLLGTLIQDECHSLKYANPKRTRAIRPLLGRAERFFLATGTPIHNRVLDLHNLLDLCAPGKFKNKWAFAEQYCQVTLSGRGRRVERLLDREGLHRDVAPYVFSVSTKEAYGELPPRVRQLVPVEVDVKRLPSLDKVLLRTQHGSEKVLRALAAHKIKAAVQLALDLDEPLLVYTYQRAHAADVCCQLNAEGVEAVLATGDAPPRKRRKLLDDWQYQGKGKVLCCTMDAVNEGVTLTRAAATVFVDLDNLPGKMDQCEGRTDPARQKEGERRPSRYYYLYVPGSYDEVVAQRVVEKISDAQGVIDVNENQEGMAKMLEDAVPVENERDVLDDLIGRLEARAKRLEEI